MFQEHASERLVPSMPADDSPGHQEPDGDHASHQGFVRGPAQAALRARVLQDRNKFPRDLRNLLWVSLCLVAVAVLMVVVLAVLEPRTLGIVAQLMALSFAVGREAAILHAYGQGPSGGPIWILVTVILDDLIILALALPLFWLGIERARGAPVLGGMILSLEKAAIDKRAFLRRWGLYGLVGFVWLPGLGAGVTLAAAMGTVAKIPLRQLILALAWGSVTVNAFWVIGLYFTSDLIPREGPWSFLPLVFVLVLVMITVAYATHQRRTRHLFPIVKVQDLEVEHKRRLLDVGITDGIHLLYANRTILAKKLDIDPSSLGRLRSVAELSMLRTVSPRHAEIL